MTAQTFPILKLPYLAFAHSTGFWNPYELYKFSLVSRKTKLIARSVSIKPSEIALTSYPDYCVSITFPTDHGGMWFFHPNEKQPKDEDYYLVDRQIHRKFRFHCDDLLTKLLEVLEQLLYVFNVELGRVSLQKNPFQCYDSIQIITWINQSEQKILPSCKFTLMTVYDLLFFFENITKPVDSLFIEVHTETRTHASIFSSSNVCTTNSIVISFLYRTSYTFIDMLKRFNFVDCKVFKSSWSNKDLNQFLTDWASDRKNCRIRNAEIEVSDPIDLNVVLCGLSVKFEDPQTVKRRYDNGKESFWISGGICVQPFRKDTLKFAQIQTHVYRKKEENSSVSEELIRAYENRRFPNLGSIGDENEDRELLRLERERAKTVFSITVFE